MSGAGGQEVYGKNQKQKKKMNNEKKNFRRQHTAKGLSSIATSLYVYCIDTHTERERELGNVPVK